MEKLKAGWIGFIRHDDDFGETLKSYPPLATGVWKAARRCLKEM